jgi:hypothetical protein
LAWLGSVAGSRTKAAKAIGVAIAVKQGLYHRERTMVFFAGRDVRRHGRHRFLVAFSGPGELVLPDHALVTVHLAFDAVLQNAFRCGQQPNDLEGAAACRFLVPVGREANGLTYRKLMC